MTQRALAAARSLTAAGHNPLAPLFGAAGRPRRDVQYPAPGINWLDGRVGYFYHSHAAPGAPRHAHGHFHLFARTPAQSGAAADESYAHLLGIDVDATGAPLRFFAPNLWVTAGELAGTDAVRRALMEFADTALRSRRRAARWIGVLLGLHGRETRAALYERQRTVGRWRREGRIARRLADRRIYILGSRGVS